MPFRQDNPITKPRSIVFDPEYIIKTIEFALDGEQIQEIETKIKTNKFLRFIIIFIVTSIVLTSVEAIIGYLGNLVLNIDIWNYENKKWKGY